MHTQAVPYYTAAVEFVVTDFHRGYLFRAGVPFLEQYLYNFLVSPAASSSPFLYSWMIAAISGSCVFIALMRASPELGSLESAMA